MWIRTMFLDGEPNTPPAGSGEGQPDAGDGGGRPDTGDSDRRLAEMAKHKKAVEDRLAAMQQADADRKKQEEEDKLKASNDIKALEDRWKSDKETMLASHKAELLSRDISTALIKAGASNDVFIAGAVAKFSAIEDGAERDKALKSFVEDAGNKPFFGQQHQTIPPAGSVPAAGSNQGTTDWTKVRDVYENPRKHEPSAVDDAIRKLSEHRSANDGRLPWER